MYETLSNSAGQSMGKDGSEVGGAAGEA